MTTPLVALPGAAPGGPAGILTRGLSSALVGVPLAETGPPPEGEPLQRQATTSEQNRSRVQENQRILAAQLLMYSLPVMGCLALLLVVLLMAGIAIYVRGWMVMSSSGSKPCDQPLKWWLLVMLLVPILQCQLNSQTTPDQRPKRLQALVMPAVIMTGIYLCVQCKTCAKTNPELFQYTRMYLIWQSAVWSMMLFMSCGLVSMVFWMHRNGLLDTGPGPASAARTGLIHELETVPYNPSLFSENQEDDMQPPECSICQEEFQEDHPIKRTPCGHFFHEPCLGNWLENYAKSCPLCRQDLEESMDQHQQQQQQQQRQPRPQRVGGPGRP